jgi:SMC interacting uncharacterized protein involved in chromosome segregation
MKIKPAGDGEIMKKKYVPFENVIKKVGKKLKISIKKEELEPIATLITNEIVKIVKTNRPKNKEEIKCIMLGPICLEMKLFNAMSKKNKLISECVGISPSISLKLLNAVNGE